MPELTLTVDCQEIIDAIDPTTGAQVTGVTVTNPTIYGDDLSGGGTDNSPNALLVPGPPA